MEKSEKLVVIYPTPDVPCPRLDSVLAAVLQDVPHELIHTADALQDVTGRRVLFAVALGDAGISLGWCAMLAALRRNDRLLEGCIGGVVIDGESELYTKSTARTLVFAANRAGCLFVGGPLVEATGRLTNFTIRARNAGSDLLGAYEQSLTQLVERVRSFEPPRYARPHLVALHASNRRTSNTMDLWNGVAARVQSDCEVTEIGLRNGVLVDCSGCPYTMCLHFGESGDCFYGGVMVSEVYPALKTADALVLVCPNYNDAISANLTACINRMTALFRTQNFYDKALYGIVVSGYSGSDIVAEQLIAALCMNKTFYLPARFALLETANDAGTAMKLPGMASRLDTFASALKKQLIK